MYSFAIHNISPDTPHTNWDNPVTERDHIRVAYRANNRGYYIRDTVRYPPAHDIVKPLVEGPGNLVEWWGVGDVRSVEVEKEEELLEGLVGGEEEGGVGGDGGEDGSSQVESKKAR